MLFSLVSIPHRYAKNPGKNRNGDCSGSRFQFLIGTLKTPALQSLYPGQYSFNSS